MTFQAIHVPETIDGGTFLAVLTDQVVCGRYEGNGRFEIWQDDGSDGSQKLLELHVFNEQAEFRAIRCTIADEFKCRTLQDPPAEEIDFFDEIHFLDQNSKRTRALEEGWTAFATTGGGEYILPGNQETRKVKVRTYLRETEDSNGIQIPFDWRIVAFCPEEAV